MEVDETYIGGKRKNMPKAKRGKLMRRGAVGKTAVVGAKDRATNKVIARRHNIREAGTLTQMQDMVAGMIGKWLMYRDLVGEKS